MIIRKSNKSKTQSKVKNYDLHTEASELLSIAEKRIDKADRNERLAELRELKGVTKEEYFYNILDDYLKGAPIKELVGKYNYSDKHIRDMIENHHQQLVNARSANALAITQKDGYNPVLEKLKKIEVLNQEFFDKLSPEDSPTLSEEEALFAWMYVHRGDSREAVEMSTLDVGLFKDQPVTYKRGIFSRAVYLQHKPNVASYIKELRNTKYRQDDVNKTYVQELLLEEIQQIKEKGDKKDSKTLSRLIELLGKTIGAFTERVEVMEVDPSKSLDLLIDMAKNATIKELE